MKKTLNRSTSFFRTKKEEPEKKNITINLTLNLNLDKKELSKIMDIIDHYSSIPDESSSYRRSFD